MISLYLYGLLAMMSLGFLTWLLSLYKHDVSIVDSVWPLMFAVAALLFAIQANSSDVRSLLILSLVLLWALRLCIFLTWRNWKEPEDRRYRSIRAKYQPKFEVKSLFIIFFFQSVLAWIIALPLLPAITRTIDFGYLDGIALLVWCTGFLFESISDWQLARFKRDPSNRGKVMDKGLWRYSRHPNYFGEFLIWWGFYLFAVNCGAWWSIPGPLLISWLLLKFSGVTMQEQTITERRPDYVNYIKRTNAFFPGRSKRNAIFESTQEST